MEMYNIVVKNQDNVYEHKVNFAHKVSSRSLIA
jgi:hypothetical protein